MNTGIGWIWGYLLFETNPSPFLSHCPTPEPSCRSAENKMRCWRARPSPYHTSAGTSGRTSKDQPLGGWPEHSNFHFKVYERIPSFGAWMDPIACSKGMFVTGSNNLRFWFKWLKTQYRARKKKSDTSRNWNVKTYLTQFFCVRHRTWLLLRPPDISHNLTFS